jgi:DNA repair protein RecO (recombination protein O)
MGIISTEAIVISTIKYSDTSLIARLYTKELGLVSYLLKGILKSKKGKLRTAYFQPLTQLSIIAKHQEKRNLQILSEAKVIHSYKTIYTSVVKQSIVLFISEILTSAIQEEENNNLLYDYLKNSFIWFDSHHQISNFHLLFLMNLTKFLGFHLREGLFTNHQGTDIIKGIKLIQFKRLLGTKFDDIEEINFSKTERQQLLQIIIRYFELHLGGFRMPKSLAVLETVFSR